MPLRIPKNQIVFNYTSGKEYLVLSTKKEYQGHYYEINGKFFAGKEFNVNAPEIVKSTSNRLNQNETQNSDIDLYNKISGLALDIINIVALPKLDDPNVDKEGTDTYYTKKHNDVVIKQIDKDTYNTIKSNPLYSTVVIKGDLSNLSEAEKQIPNITLFVKPLPNFSLADVPYIVNTPLEPTIKPTPVTSSISTTPKPQDIIPVGPIYEKGAVVPQPPTPPPPSYTLRLTFDNIGNAPVGNPNDVLDWNGFFGTTFDSLNVTGNTVALTSNTKTQFGLADSLFDSNNYLISIDDDGLITTAGESCFAFCPLLTSVSLPELVTAGAGCFANCISLTSVSLPELVTAGNVCFYSCNLTSISLPKLTSIGGGGFFGISYMESIYIPSCNFLGETVGNDYVFELCSIGSVTLTIPSSLMTCNSGNPDGDISFFQNQSAVTIITV